MENEQRNTALGWFNRPKKATEPLSGTGSTIDSAKELIVYLNNAKRKLNLTSITDIPCGDWTWMSQVNLTGIRYIGLDIVPQLIERNMKLYPGVSFKVFDILKEIPPESDMIICRDFCSHLNNKDVQIVLSNIKKSGSKYMLISSYPIITNEFRDTTIVDYTHQRFAPINMELAPFLLKAEDRIIEKAKVCGNREVLLVDLQKE